MWKISIGILAALALTAGALFATRPSVKRTGAEDTSAASTAVLRVDGMTCPSCGFTVSTALRRLDGVREAKVAQAEGRAVIEYDALKVTPQRMIEAVNAVGYRARLPDEVAK